MESVFTPLVVLTRICRPKLQEDVLTYQCYRHHSVCVIAQLVVNDRDRRSVIDVPSQPKVFNMKILT
jgi:hypothetical protein